MKKYLGPIMLTALLSACGGGSGGGSGVAGIPDPPDAFASVVAARFMDQSDTADVVPSLDEFTVTTPETTEPAVII